MRVVVGALLMLSVGVGVTLYVTDRASSDAQADSETVRAVTGNETAAVRRGDLTSEREFKAVVSFGDTWMVTTAATGTVTARHGVGTVIDFGQSLVRVDNKPLFLAQGSMPMYRELSKADTRRRDQNGDRLTLLSGLDVRQLQAFLISVGQDADGDLEVDGVFGLTTEKALKAWQEVVGLAVTGRVDSTSLVFGPDPVRIATESRVGSMFAGLEVNSAEPKVLVDTSNRDRTALSVGTDVVLALPGEGDLAGTVTKQAETSAADGSQLWRTTIVADGPLPGDARNATVTVTEVAANNVTYVPVASLLALAEGGFAVEVGAGLDTRLVRVAVGVILDGQAEITGDIVEGDQVVIPT